MDGIESLSQVVIVAATNRPDKIDPALLRPGRLDSLIYVPLPDAAAREEIFRIRTQDMPLADSTTGAAIDIETLVARTEGYSGAEVTAVCTEAGLAAMADFLRSCESEEAVTGKPGVRDGTEEQEGSGSRGEGWVRDVATMKVTMDHFLTASEAIKPRTSLQAIRAFERYQESN